MGSGARVPTFEVIVALAALTAFVSAADLPEGIPRDDVLFYASYAKGETADLAAGKAEPVQGKGSTKEAAWRQVGAREFGAGLGYTAAGNISPNAGTIALWFSSRWEPADGKLHLLFDWIGKEGVGYNRILLYKYAGSNGIYFGIRSRKGAKTTRKVAVVHPTKGWKAGQWRHLVATWDGAKGEMRLYVDGGLARKSRKRWELGQMPKLFYVGGPGTMIADLLILKRALNSEEARDLFAGYRASPVPNRHFEKSGAAAAPAGWSGGRRETPGRRGGACLRLDAKGAAGASAEISVEPGKLHRARFWAKTPDGACLRVTASGLKRCELDGPTDWTRHAFVFRAPAGTPRVRLSFLATAGSAWVDDVEVSVDESPYANLLRHPSFEISDSNRPPQYWMRFLDYMRDDARSGVLDASESFHGAKSLRLEPGQAYSFWNESRAVLRGYRSKHRFTCSVWVKSKGGDAAVELLGNAWGEDNWNRSTFKTSRAAASPRWTWQTMKLEIMHGLLEFVIRNAGRTPVWVDAAQLTHGWDERPFTDAYYGGHGEGLWPAPVTRRASRSVLRALQCPEARKAPVVDGKLDDDAWKGARRLPAFQLCRGGRIMATRPKAATEVYLCRKGGVLYAAYRCHYPAKWKLAAEQQPPFRRRPKSLDRNVFKNDYVELFIDADMDGRTYWQFAADPLGQKFDAACGRVGSAWDGSWQAAAGKEKNAWTLEMAVPLRQLGRHVAEGARFRFCAARGLNKPGRGLEVSAVFAAPHSVRMFRTLAFGRLAYEARLDAPERQECGPADVRVRLVGGRKPTSVAGRLTVLTPLGKTLVREATPALLAPGVEGEIRFAFRAAAPGAHELRAETWTTADPKAKRLIVRTLDAFAPVRPRSTFARGRSRGVTLTVRELAGMARRSEPVRAGVPFPKGALGGAAGVTVRGPDGKAVLSQKRVLARWLDGSVMSLLVDFPADVGANGVAKYTLECGARAAAAPRGKDILRSDGAHITLDTGALRMRFPRRRFPAPFALRMKDDAGEVYDSSGPVSGFVIEENGPARAVARITGRLCSRSGRKLFAYAVRITALRGKSFLRMEVSLLNDKDTAMNTAVREASLSVARPGVTRLRTQGDAGTKDCAVPARVMQIRRVKQAGKFRLEPELGYVIDGPAGREIGRGVRHSGVFILEGKRPLLLAVEDFAQTHPQEVLVGEKGVEVFFWPRDRVRRLDLSVGVARTLALAIDFAPPESGTFLRAAGLLKPPLVTCPAEWYCASGAFGGVYMPARPKRFPLYEGFLDGFFTRLMDYPEISGLTGAFDYGDTIKSGLAGWHNNQTMRIHHFLVQYVRTLNPRYWRAASRLMRHMRDVDIPKARVRRKDIVGAMASPGSFPHTDKFPSSSHNWSEGALDYYLLTGDRRALDVARGICDFLVRYLTARKARGTMGQPYRNHGWTLMQVCRLYEVTREKRYLDCAQLLVSFLRQAATARDGGWESTGRNVFHGGTCCNGLWRYAALTNDPATRRLALKMTDWLFRIQPEDAVELYPWTWRETVFFYPLASAYAATGDAKYVRAGFRHIYAGFGRGLIWTTAPFTAQLMPFAEKLGLKEPDLPRAHMFRLLYHHSVFVREDKDGAFSLRVMAVRPRGSEAPTIVCTGPTGKRVLTWKGPPPQTKRKRVYETHALRIPADGVTGTYRFDVRCRSVTRFSYRCDLPKLVIKGGVDFHGGYFLAPEGVKRFRIRVKGIESKPRLRCAVSVLGPDGVEKARLVWWKTAPKRMRFSARALEVRPAPSDTGKLWRLRVRNVPYVTFEGTPPYVAAHPDAYFTPKER